VKAEAERAAIEAAADSATRGFLDAQRALVTLVFRDSIVLASGETMVLKGPTTFVWERRVNDWLITYADADHYPVTSP
jgi:hypothetical protein